MEFKALLEKDEFIIFDGGTGTMLQANGLKSGEKPELLNITAPDVLKKIHREYIDAGADVITANTFGANRYKLSGSGYSVNDVITAAVKNLTDAIKESGKTAYPALDIGPVGRLSEPAGDLTFEEAYDIFKEEITAGANAGAELVIIETMADLHELKAAVLAAKENCSLPIICSMTYEENGRTFTGCPVAAEAALCAGLGVSAAGVNCSLGPNELMPIVKELCDISPLPVIVMPNAGLPDPESGEYTITAEEFADRVFDMAQLGVKLIGGCCGTTPQFIRAVSERLKGTKPVKRDISRKSTVCSGTKVCVADRPLIVGERINPTGKKLFRQALLDKNTDYILGQAIEQANAGADILDVNVGLPDIDEKDMMIRVIKGIQSVCDLPLQIDSSDPEVIEAALRICIGKPIVNSVNGNDETLDAILPLVKKYGAAVVGLTLDSRGIPQSCAQRLEIAEKIITRALDAGIPKEDIYIDCLTLTVSAEPEAARETLNAVRAVKEKYGVKTILGVSNISFGLPQRELLNSAFLTMALENGLDLAIINPNIAAMTGAVRAFSLLSGARDSLTGYISAYGEQGAAPVKPAAKHEITLEYAIENGLKGEAAELTKELLAACPPMDIVNGRLIPALDRTGAQFENGKIFLPQLIISAAAAQSCFEVIRAQLSDSRDAPVSKGKIVLATVKGDIHDIGKNIVKVLLENYGYTVIDLGKDVPCQAVVDAAIEHKVKLVGLSALMTTTVRAMEETIKLLKQQAPDCRVVVGGAVLTPEYAEKIGADFYAKDAKETVDIARRVIG